MGNLTDCIKKVSKGKLTIESKDKRILTAKYKKYSKDMSEQEASNSALTDLHKILFDELNHVRKQAGLPASKYVKPSFSESEKVQPEVKAKPKSKDVKADVEAKATAIETEAKGIAEEMEAKVRKSKAKLGALVDSKNRVRGVVDPWGDVRYYKVTKQGKFGNQSIGEVRYTNEKNFQRWQVVKDKDGKTRSNVAQNIKGMVKTLKTKSAWNVKHRAVDPDIKIKAVPEETKKQQVRLAKKKTKQPFVLPQKKKTAKPKPKPKGKLKKGDRISYVHVTPAGKNLGKVIATVASKTPKGYNLITNDGNKFVTDKQVENELRVIKKAKVKKPEAKITTFIKFSESAKNEIREQAEKQADKKKLKGQKRADFINKILLDKLPKAEAKSKAEYKKVIQKAVDKGEKVSFRVLKDAGIKHVKEVETPDEIKLMLEGEQLTEFTGSDGVKIAVGDNVTKNGRNAGTVDEIAEKTYSTEYIEDLKQSTARVRGFTDSKGNIVNRSEVTVRVLSPYGMGYIFSSDKLSKAEPIEGASYTSYSKTALDDAELNKELSRLRKVKEVSALAPDIKAELLNEYELLLNPEATEFIRRVGMFEDFKGMVLEPRSVSELVSRMRNRVKKYRRKDSKANVNRLAKQIEDAYRAGETPVFYLTPEVLGEERFHRFALINSASKKVEGLLDNKGKNKIKKTLPSEVMEGLQKQYGDNEAVLINEAVAKVANGEIEFEGSEKFLLTWAKEYARFNKVKTMKDFKELNDFTQKVFGQLEEFAKAPPKKTKKRKKKDAKSTRKSNADVSKKQGEARRKTAKRNETDGKKDTKQKRTKRGEAGKKAEEARVEVEGAKERGYAKTAREKLGDDLITENLFTYVGVPHQTTDELAQEVVERSTEAELIQQLEDFILSDTLPTAKMIRAGQIVSRNQRKRINDLIEEKTDKGSAKLNEAVIKAEEAVHNKTVGVIARLYTRLGRAVESVKIQLEEETDVTGRLIRGKLKRVKNKKVKDELLTALEEGESILTVEEENRAKELEAKLKEALDAVTALEKEIEELKKDKDSTKRKGRRDFWQLKDEVDSRVVSNLDTITKAFGGSPIKGASYSKSVLEAKRQNRETSLDDLAPEVQTALVEYSMSVLMNRLFEKKVKKGKPKPKPIKPISIKEFDALLNKVSNNSLSDRQIQEIHTQAIGAIKGTQRKSEPMKGIAKVRLDHYKRAKDVSEGRPDFLQYIVNEGESPSTPEGKLMFQKGSVYDKYREEIILGAIYFAEDGDAGSNDVANYIENLIGKELDPQEQLNLARGALFLHFTARNKVREWDKPTDKKGIKAYEKKQKLRRDRVRELNAIRRDVNEQLRRLSARVIVPSKIKGLNTAQRAWYGLANTVRRLDRIHTGQAIAGIATNVTNEITAVGAGTAMGFENAVDLILQKAFGSYGLKGGMHSPEAPNKKQSRKQFSQQLLNEITLGSSMIGLDRNWKRTGRRSEWGDMPLQDPLIMSLENMMENYEQASEILDAYPREFSRLFGDLIPDLNLTDTGIVREDKTATKLKKMLSKTGNAVLDAGNWASTKLITLNLVLEEKNRAAVFVHILRNRVDSRGGKTLDTMIEDGEFSITPEDFEVATRKALKITFADHPDGMFMKRLVSFFQRIPLIINPFRFARVAYNMAEFAGTRLPIAGLVASKKIFDSESSSVINSQNLSKQISGLVMLSIAYGARSLLGDETSKWYYVRIPSTDTVFDIRRYQPFATFYFLADRIVRGLEGRRMFSDFEEWEDVLPINTGFYNPMNELMFGKDSAMLDSLFIKGVPSTARAMFGLASEEEMNPAQQEKVNYHLQRLGAGTIGTFLNGLGNAGDLMKVFFHDETVPDQYRDPFWGTIGKEVPFHVLARMAGYESGQLVVEDPVTGLPKKLGDPFMRMIGFKNIPIDELPPPMTPAEETADFLGRKVMRVGEATPMDMARSRVRRMLLSAVYNDLISQDKFEERVDYYTQNGMKGWDGKPDKTPLFTAKRAQELKQAGEKTRLEAKATKLTYNRENKEFMDVYRVATPEEKIVLDPIKISKEAKLEKELKSEQKTIEDSILLNKHRGDVDGMKRELMGRKDMDTARKTKLLREVDLSFADKKFITKSLTEKVYLFKNEPDMAKKVRMYALMHNSQVRTVLAGKNKKKPREEIQKVVDAIREFTVEAEYEETVEKLKTVVQRSGAVPKRRKRRRRRRR